MPKHSYRLPLLSACTALLITYSATTLGDDTELYVGLANDAAIANPNILFIVDTSGSMDNEVETTTAYDADRQYEADGAGRCNDDSQIFFSDNGEVPGCNALSLPKSTLVCQHARDAIYGGGSGRASGYYTDLYGVWLSSIDNWTIGSSVGNNFQYITHLECLDDVGEHGESASGENWPVNGSAGPWVLNRPEDKIWNDWQSYTLYSANFLRWYHYSDEVEVTTRLDVVKQVMNDLINSVSKVNIGLMRFDVSGSNRNGGPIIFPITDIDNPGVRAAIRSAVNNLNANGNTPPSETLYEAYLYYFGKRVKYGTKDNGMASHADATTRAGRRTRYIPPAQAQCGSNHIVVLSDGLPTTDGDADDEINELIDSSDALSLGNCQDDDDRHGNNDNCLDELAEYLYETDSDASLDGVQRIVTHTVGFNVDDTDLLERTARAGQGRDYYAVNARELSNAFTQIIENAQQGGTTFTAPAVSINGLNRLVHNDAMYFSVFQPTDRAFWPGNIKKFRVKSSSTDQPTHVDADNDGEDDSMIVDANGAPAVDPSTATFFSGAHSLWTPGDLGPDGAEPSRGGLASRLFDYDSASGQHDAAGREHKVFTYTGTSNGGVAITRLTDPVNHLHEDNAFIADSNPQGNITREMLGLAGDDTVSDEQFKNLLRWARGVDVDDEDGDGVHDDGRAVLGASLHAPPYLLTYHAGNSDDQQDYLFVLTNDGFVHMVIASNAGEDIPTDGSQLVKWSFMPAPLLTNIKTLYDNDASDNITYGLDGGVDVWIHDVNDDGDLLDANGKVDALDDESDEAIVYFGQRRGGRRYFALDVTEPDEPKYLWSIGGESSAGPSNPLSRLGQSWSRPRHTRIYHQASNETGLSARDVVVFGGGYDVSQDAGGASRSADALGNAIFIVDAKSAEVLWWAGGAPGADQPVPDLELADMKYSIPADIRILDLNGDGVTDRFYAADMGGQIWRFDIANHLTGPLADRIVGGRIADLQGASAADDDGQGNDNRRFYYPPDVAYIEPHTGQPFHSVAIGSGYRAHPNDRDTRDRIYLIKDYDIQSPPTDDNGNIAYTTRYEKDLLDVSVLERDQPFTDQQNGKLANGWYVRLGTTGVKVLSSSLTIGGRVLVTAYVPPDPDSNLLSGNCGPNLGSARLYDLGAYSGEPIAGPGSTENGGTPITSSGSFHELDQNSIPSTVKVIFEDDGDGGATSIVNTEVVPEIDVDDAPKKTYWYQYNVH